MVSASTTSLTIACAPAGRTLSVADEDRVRERRPILHQFLYRSRERFRPNIHAARMSKSTPPHIVVVLDPGLLEASGVRKLLPAFTVDTDLARLPEASIAVLTVPTAQSALPVTPSTTAVIVHARGHERDRALDLYDLGAAMVVLDAPAEELAARVRALARHTQQVQQILGAHCHE
jgi:hypothetical protein